MKKSKSLFVAAIFLLNGGLFADTNMLHIATSVATTSGMEPAVGNYAVPEAITCTAPTSVDTNSIRYTCTGYTLETYADGVWSLVDTVTGSTSFNCPADGTPRRITWQWEATHYKVTIQLVPADSGSVTVDPALPEDGYCAKGTKLTMTATPNEGREHIGWATASAGYYTSQFSTTVNAAQTIKVGMAGKWTYSGKTLANGVWSLKVDGGQMVSYYSGFGKLDLSDVYSDTGIKITSTYQTIFQNNKMIKFLIAPDITYLGSRAFQSSGLQDARFTDSLKQIGGTCFSDVTSLTNFEPKVSNNLTSIGGEAFKNCKNMRGDLVYSNLVSSSTYCFYGTAITSANCPKLSPSTSFFATCESLTNVVILGTTVGKTLFSGCKKLQNVHILSPTGASSFPQWVFRDTPTSLKIWYYGRKAPSSIASDAFFPSKGAPYIRIFIKNGYDIEQWQVLSERVQNPGATGIPALTTADKNISNYPGRTRTIGIGHKGRVNSKPVWFVKWPVGLFSFLTLH